MYHDPITRPKGLREEILLGNGQAGREKPGFQGGNVLLVDQTMIDGRDRVLPDLHFLRMVNFFI